MSVSASRDFNLTSDARDYKLGANRKWAVGFFAGKAGDSSEVMDLSLDGVAIDQSPKKDVPTTAKKVAETVAD